MMTILRWLNSVSLELFYPFAVHINLLIMTRILAGNKLLNKKDLFCFRPLAYHMNYGDI